MTAQPELSDQHRSCGHSSVLVIQRRHSPSFSTWPSFSDDGVPQQGLSEAGLKRQKSPPPEAIKSLVLKWFKMLSSLVSDGVLNLAVAGMGKEVENLLAENKQLLETK